MGFEPIKIYNKAMKLIKKLSSKEVSKIFWDQKSKKRDLNVHPSVNKKKKGNKDAGTTKRNSTKKQGKKRVRRSGRAR